MTPATQEQIEEACVERDADAAARYLRHIGLDAPRERCRATVNTMVADGRRKRFLPDNRVNLADQLTRLDAEMGCKLLLSRHLKAGQHWINDPAKMGAALRMAGMVSP